MKEGSPNHEAQPKPQWQKPELAVELDEIERTAIFNWRQLKIACQSRSRFTANGFGFVFGIKFC